MKTRTFITALLILTLTLNVAAHGRAQSQDDSGEAEITPQEEQEARALAVRFMKRLGEIDDFSLLTNEFFLDDFTERFQQSLSKEEEGDSKEDDDPFAFIDRPMLLHAGRGDLQRTYVALMNFWQQGELLRGALSKLETQEAKDGVPRQMTVRPALLSQLYSNANGDPLLARFVAGLFRPDDSLTDQDDTAIMGQVRSNTIKSVERLRSFTGAVERCTTSMRDAVKKLRLESEDKECPSSATDESKVYDVYKFWTDFEGAEKHGFAAGTVLIYARIYPYEMVMARVNGQLKMLYVYPDFDGD